MKVQNRNHASQRTRRLIRKVFAEMLSEKREVGRISVSELCKRAGISRGSFYTHYDDIYGVAEDYENELVDVFFDKARLIRSQDILHFIDSIFAFTRQNDENYRLLCRSNDFLFTAKRLTAIATEKFLELCRDDDRLRERPYLELEIRVFLDGLLCEYVRYCRGYTAQTPEDLYAYTKLWVTRFLQETTA